MSDTPPVYASGDHAPLDRGQKEMTARERRSQRARRRASQNPRARGGNRFMSRSGGGAPEDGTAQAPGAEPASAYGGVAGVRRDDDETTVQHELVTAHPVIPKAFALTVTPHHQQAEVDAHLFTGFLARDTSASLGALDPRRASSIAARAAAHAAAAATSRRGASSSASSAAAQAAAEAAAVTAQIDAAEAMAVEEQGVYAPRHPANALASRNVRRRLQAELRAAALADVENREREKYWSALKREGIAIPPPAPVDVASAASAAAYARGVFEASFDTSDSDGDGDGAQHPPVQPTSPSRQGGMHGTGGTSGTRHVLDGGGRLRTAPDPFVPHLTRPIHCIEPAVVSTAGATMRGDGGGVGPALPLAESIVPTDDDVPQRLQTRSTRPTTVAGDAGSAGASVAAELEIDVAALAIHAHPDFSEEDHLFVGLRQLYGGYRHRIESNLAEHYSQRLDALLAQLESMIERHDDADGAVDDLRAQAVEAFSCKVAEEAAIAELAVDINRQWEKLLKARKNNNDLRVTPAGMVARVVAVDPVAAQRAESQANKIGGIADGLRQRLEDTKVERTRRREQGNDGTDSHLDDEKKFQAAAKARAALIFHAERALEQDEALREALGDERVVLKVTADGPVDLDLSAHPVEQRRRQRIAKQRIFVAVAVDGRRVTRSATMQLGWPIKVLEPRLQVRLKLVRRPERIEVQIWRSKFRLGPISSSRKLAAVTVPVPGTGIDDASTHAFAPSKGWYSFSGIAPAVAGQFVGRPNTFGVTPLQQTLTGAVGVRIAWGTGAMNVEDGTAVAALLPDRIDRSAQELLQGLPPDKLRAALRRQHGGVGDDDGDIQAFTRERDFLALLPPDDEIDPNDPRNERIVRLLAERAAAASAFGRAGGTSRTGFGEGTFRTNWSTSTRFENADPRRWKPSKRHLLLDMRRDSPQSFKDPIPLSDFDIKHDAHHVGYNEMLRRSNAALARGGSEEQTGTGLRRGQIQGFVNRIRQRAAERKARRGMVGTTRTRAIPLASVVQEDMLPEFKLDVQEISAFFAPKRKLRPKKTERKARSMQVQGCTMFVQVVSARNVPMRESNTGQLGSAQGRGRASTIEAESGLGGAEALGAPSANKAATLQTFVEVTFQGLTKRTRCSSGSSPIWKENLGLPFTPVMNDFSPQVLAQIRDEVHIAIFDEVLMGGAANETGAGVRVQRTEKRFLGRCSVPFSTVLMQGTVNGTFRVDVPPGILGYVRERGRTTIGENHRVHEEAETATTLQLMLTLNPPLSFTPDEDEAPPILGTGFELRLQSHTKNWLAKLRGNGAHMRSRMLQVLVPNIDGDFIFISRYIAPQGQAPPPSIARKPSVESIVRFVSMIPFLEDWQAFVAGDGAGGLNGDVWCTSSEFLDMRGGDWEEHALLLLNYLIWFDKRSSSSFAHYLVLGSAIPEGESCYVLRLNKSNMEGVLWNASTGTGYALNDTKCPLMDVGMLVTDNQIYANVSVDGHPSKLRFDVDADNGKMWRPFFSESSFTGSGTMAQPPETDIPTVQDFHLEYPPTSDDYVRKLESELMETLKTEVRDWRSSRTATSFNPEAGRRLRPLLELFERHKQGDTGFNIDDEQRKVISTMQATRKLNGLPINCLFTEIPKVVEEVKLTNVHATQDPSVQFALSVYVHAYECEICSIWVYFAAMVKRGFTS